MMTEQSNSELKNTSVPMEDIVLVDEKELLKNLEEKYVLIVFSLLKLDNEDASSRAIVLDLLHNGRKKLRKYEDDIMKTVFKKQMEPNSYLLQELENYIQQMWKISSPWLEDFLLEQQKSSNDLYHQILQRAAESVAMYRSPLAVLVQFLYRMANDKDFEEPDGDFHCIIQTLTRNGRKAGPPSDLVTRALKVYLHDQLFDILRSCKVPISEQDVYDQALDCVAENGWIALLSDDKVQDLLAPKVFRQLCETIRKYDTSGLIPRIISTTVEESIFKSIYIDYAERTSTPG